MPASVPQTGKNDCEEKKVVNGDNTDNRKMNAEVTARKKYKCPVCGYYTLDGFYGSYDICPVCFWEEDGLQFDEPLAGGGANGACLIRARINFHEFGAAEKRMLKNVRPPEPSELSGKDYKSPILWYAEEEDRLLLQTFSYTRSSLEELDWRADALHLKRTEIPWLTLDGDPDPTKWKQLPFREAIKKLSTYEMKRGMLYYLGPEDWSFLEKEYGPGWQLKRRRSTRSLEQAQRYGRIRQPLPRDCKGNTSKRHTLGRSILGYSRVDDGVVKEWRMTAAQGMI